MGNILYIRKNFSNKEEFNKFIEQNIEKNIEKMNYLQFLFMIINLVLPILGLIGEQCHYGGNKSYSNIIIANVVIICSSVIWIIFYYKLRDKFNTMCKGIVFFVYCNIIIYWCIFIDVTLFTLNRQVSVYIIGVFTISAVFYLRPIVCLVMQSLAYIVMVFTLGIISNNDIGLYNIINLTVTFVVSNIASITVFNHYLQDYFNKKRVVKKNKALQKLNEERNEFLANVSHELRTPLNILHTAQQMIEITAERESYSSDGFNKYMGLMKQNTNRLTRMINNLLDITNINSRSFIFDKKNLNIIKIIEDVTLSAVDYIESKGISLIFDTDVEELIIACDSQSIERIMLNLLSNAVKFTNKGGSIFVNIHSYDEYISISVKDTGIGIEKEMQNEIFKRFIQVDKSMRRKNEGTGIGLSLVEELVKLHDGTIELDSKIDEGSTFTVNLPKVVIKDSDVTGCFIVDAKDNERVAIEFSDIYMD